MDIMSLKIIGLQILFTDRGPLLLTLFSHFTLTDNAVRTKIDRL